MEQGYRTLRQVASEQRGASYQKVHRAVSTLREAALVNPWHGDNNELRLTLDDSLRAKRFLGFLENGETMRSAVPKLESEILRSQVEALQKENERLKAVVEWKPQWWARVLRWLVPRRSRLGAKVWNWTAPEARTG